jgi:competence protein ComGC
MKKLTLIVMFLVLLVISIVIRDQVNNAQSDSRSTGKETYVSQVIINAPRGE